MRFKAGFAALLSLGMAAAAAAEPTTVDQSRAEEQRLSTALVEAAGKLRATETALLAAMQQVGELTERRREAEARLREREAAMAPLLPLAERLGLFPAETLLAVPAPPEQAVRGLSVLHGLMRTVELQAAGVRAELGRVAAAQGALDEALPRLRAAEAEQRRQAAFIDRQLALARAARSRIEDAAAEQARREQAEASRAESLGGVLDSMAASRERTQALLQQDAERAERQRREPALAITRQRQAQIAAPAGPGVQDGAVLPVAGPVVRHWGEPTDAGPAHGIAFRAPPKGRVVAPCAGRVAFAGPFRSYGVLVIVDCGGGYHFVLAGLDRLDAEAGDKVQAGEPLGVMPDWTASDAGSRPALYVELRRAGRPVDPSPFLRAGS